MSLLKPFFWMGMKCVFFNAFYVFKLLNSKSTCVVRIWSGKKQLNKWYQSFDFLHKLCNLSQKIKPLSYFFYESLHTVIVEVRFEFQPSVSGFSHSGMKPFPLSLNETLAHGKDTRQDGETYKA